MKHGVVRRLSAVLLCGLSFVVSAADALRPVGSPTSADVQHPAAVQQPPPAAGETIPLHYGINSVVLSATGEGATVLLARRENFNAHGFDVVTLYIETREHDESPAQFTIIPIFSSGAERLELTAGGGADCRLNDFRLVHRAGRDAELITASRQLGSSYADPAVVKFEYFTLKRNASGDVGRPDFYFERQRTVMARRMYCDVNEAFDVELGLARYRPDDD